MTARKLTRKELLKQDEFLTTMEKARNIWVDYRREIIFGVTGILVVVVLLVAGSFYVNSRRASAWRALAEALESYHGTVVGEASPSQAGPTTKRFVSETEKYEETMTALDQVIARYSRTPSGRLARLYRANSLMNLGRYAEAREEYAAFEEANGRQFISALARLNAARSYQLEGDLDTALAKFKELSASAAEYGFPLDTVLMALAECHREMGDLDQAVDAYQRVVTEFPDSAYRYPAEQRLDELGGGAEEAAIP